MISKNQIFPTDVPKVLYENRYCSQEGFSILVCGGQNENYEDTNKVLEIKIPSFKVTEFPPMVKPHNRLHLTTINSEIVAIVDSTSNCTCMGKMLTPVEIYSEKSKTWKHQHIEFEERFFYCKSSYIKKLEHF